MTPNVENVDQSIIEAVNARFDVVLHQVGTSKLDFITIEGVPHTELYPFEHEVCEAITNYLSHGDTARASKTALEINDAILKEIDEPEDGYSASECIWTIMLQTVYQIPYDHSFQAKLAALIFAFTKIPEERSIRLFSDRTLEWQSLRELPSLGFHLSEIWQGAWPSVREAADFTELVKATDDRWEAWLRLNAFVAHVFSYDIESVGRMRELHCFAIWTLRSTVLEYDHSNLEQIRRDIMMSSAWILNGGKQLHALQRENNLEKQLDRALGGGPLYHGPPSICQARWDLWHKRFQEIANSELEIDAETRHLATKAFIHMEKVQADDQS